MRTIIELYIDWRIRRLALKLMLSERIIDADLVLQEAIKIYRSPLQPHEQF